MQLLFLEPFHTSKVVKWLSSFWQSENLLPYKDKVSQEQESYSRTFFSFSKANSVTNKGIHRFSMQWARINEGVSHSLFAEF